MKMAGIAVGGLVLILLYLIFLSGGAEYADHDTSEVEKAKLFQATEKLLADSEAWPTELSSEGVAVASSLDVYPVRAVRYQVDIDGDFDKVVEYVRDENYSGKTRRQKKDKYEDTLYEKDEAGGPYEWVRRSVHVAPPPGGNRDAVVLYFEDRPDPNTYRIAFQSIETIGGKGFPEVEDAVRFKVLPSMYKVEKLDSGKVRVRKVEGVDPRGSMSTLMNNYFISLMFFRDYMFEQAKDMRASLSEAQG